MIGGLIFGPVNAVFATIVQENTRPEMLGRVFGALTALAFAGVLIDAALTGFAIEGLGLVPTIAGLGGIYVANTLAMFLNQALKRMDEARERVDGS